jgi:chromosome segregation ATPase
MKLFNQTRKPLQFDNSSGIVIRWEPYGAANVPDELVAALRQQRFPVEVTPVAPEVRATAIAQEAAAEQRGDQLEVLKAEVATAKASEVTAKKSAEDALSQLADLQADVKAAEAKASEQHARAESLSADKRALEAKLEETAKQLESAVARVGQLEAELGLAKGDGKAGAKLAKPSAK